MIQMDDPIIKKETDVYSRSDDKGLILASSPPEIFEMNQLACEIWELIDSKKRRRDIVEEIRLRYPNVGEEAIDDDVSFYLNELKQYGLVTYCEDRTNED
jgi:hypothetical protein